MIYTEPGYCAGCEQKDREIERLRRLQSMEVTAYRVAVERAERVEARLARVVLSTWQHRCPDGIGGCTAVSEAALAAAQPETDQQRIDRKRTEIKARSRAAAKFAEEQRRQKLERLIAAAQVEEEK